MATGQVIAFVVNNEFLINCLIISIYLTWQAGLYTYGNVYHTVHFNVCDTKFVQYASHWYNTSPQWTSEGHVILKGVAISGESFVTNNGIHTDLSITTFHCM